MSKKAGYLLGIFLTILIGAILYYITNHNLFGISSENNTNKLENSKVLEYTKNPFIISDDKTGFKVQVPENFNFLISDSSLIKPISNNLLDAISKLKGQLLKNPKQILNITGFFKSEEINKTTSNNLGLARANSIKEFLSSYGISDKQLSTSYLLNDSIVSDENNTLFGPLAFDLSDGSISSKNSSLPLSASDRKKYEKLIGTSFVLNFNTGKSSTNLTRTQKQKLLDISNAIKALGLKISIVGHTDSVGSKGFNKVLGQKRANFIKSKLLENGSSESNIVTSSKGENQPISSNNTKNGRSKNRRTVITIN